MTTEQNYLEGSVPDYSGTQINVSDCSKMRKRIFKTAPTLVTCQYKPEVFRKSRAKYMDYRHKVGACILLVARFYINHVRRSRFNFDDRQKFSTTNLHGVFSGGFKLIERIDPNTKKPIKLKNARSNNYSEEVNFITDRFLILVEKASLHNGPALWRFKELDLDDIILVELFDLVDKYEEEIGGLILKFHDARFCDETEVICEFIEECDVEFFVDVMKIWMR